jgi:adenine-specific DNA-methyltransferase
MLKDRKGMLLHSENLRGLDFLITKGFYNSIDLVYIDPPYATGNTFTVTGKRAESISQSKGGEIAYRDTLKGDDYLFFLRKRLFMIRELMSERSSIYLHIDCKIGHSVKTVMDEVFGAENFINDISRIKCNPKNFKRKAYGNIKDMILFYSKTDDPIWNEPYLPFSESELARNFSKRDSKGRAYQTVALHGPGETSEGETSKTFRGIHAPAGRHWYRDTETLEEWDRQGLIEWSGSGNPRKIVYADESKGLRVQDIWNFKDPPHPDYPTQKNADMLDLIIRTSSNENSIVMDCFCGSGSTLAAAQRNGRRWIGIDESEKAISVAEKNTGEAAIKIRDEEV